MESGFADGIHNLAEKLKKWNFKVFRNIFGRKKQVLARIRGIQKALDKRLKPSLIKLKAHLKAQLENVLR